MSSLYPRYSILLNNRCSAVSHPSLLKFPMISRYVVILFYRFSHHASNPTLPCFFLNPTRNISSPRKLPSSSIRALPTYNSHLNHLLKLMKFSEVENGFAVRGDMSDRKVKVGKEGAFKPSREWPLKYCFSLLPVIV
jgi:hypothetical protein